MLFKILFTDNLIATQTESDGRIQGCKPSSFITESKCFLSIVICNNYKKMVKFLF